VVISRATLRRALKRAGCPPAAHYTHADGFSVVEFVDYWGLTPSIPGCGADIPDLKEALKSAGISYTMGNVIMVPKQQPQP
jgi:hypothetical protein